MRHHTSCPCPQVYFEDSTRTVLPIAFLLLESLPGVNLEVACVSPDGRQRIDRELTDVMLELHSHTREMFGNMYGPAVPRWTDIFLPRLLELQQDMQTRLPAAVLHNIDIACGAASRVLSDSGVPALVH